MPRLLFIINPISGGKKKLNIPYLIKKHIDSKFEYEIKFTQFKNHGKDLTVEAVKNNVDIVVAVGGDGTINECASSLLNSKTVLGIIPLGSGNGLARHLKIPLKVKKGIDIINRYQYKKIDVAFLNDKIFLSNAGFGFIADVANEFDKKKSSRGFIGYAFQTLKLFFTYKSEFYKIETDTENIEGNYFAVNICNSNQFGYEAKISPTSDLSDGLLNIVLLKKTNFLNYVNVMYQLFFGNVLKNKSIHHFNATRIIVEGKSIRLAQTDGEPIEVTSISKIYILANSLNIIVP
jgi:diacylglycerol kinase (ATP)